ncbi:hypothetical protein GBAR_LOCUS27609 [Geodia barretti]|nr:hypothetical protein GBAR_LOCUS27609 [Geodia barretti]
MPSDKHEYQSSDEITIKKDETPKKHILPKLKPGNESSSVQKEMVSSPFHSDTRRKESQYGKRKFKGKKGKMLKSEKELRETQYSAARKAAAAASGEQEQYSPDREVSGKPTHIPKRKGEVESESKDESSPTSSSEEETSEVASATANVKKTVAHTGQMIQTADDEREIENKKRKSSKKQSLLQEEQHFADKEGKRVTPEITTPSIPPSKDKYLAKGKEKENIAVKKREKEVGKAAASGERDQHSPGREVSGKPTQRKKDVESESDSESSTSSASEDEASKVTSHASATENVKKSKLKSQARETEKHAEKKREKAELAGKKAAAVEDSAQEDSEDEESDRSEDKEDRDAEQVYSNEEEDTEPDYESFAATSEDEVRRKNEKSLKRITIAVIKGRQEGTARETGKGKEKGVRVTTNAPVGSLGENESPGYRKDQENKSLKRELSDPGKDQEEREIKSKKRSRRRHRENSMSPMARGSSSPSTSQEEQNQPRTKGLGKQKRQKKKEHQSRSSEIDDSSPESDRVKNLPEDGKKKLAGIFTRFFGELCCAIVNPVVIAAELQKKCLISKATMIEMFKSPESQQDKTIGLVSQLEKKIDSDPDCLFVFIEVLLQNQALQSTGNEMLRETGKVCPDRVAVKFPRKLPTTDSMISSMGRMAEELSIEKSSARKDGGRSSQEPRSESNVSPEKFVGFLEPELVNLTNIVGVRVKVKWRSIGLGLSFKDWELNGIYATKCRELDPPQECMTEVFSQWKSGLKNEYSWKKLAEVLVSPAVNETELLGHMYKELTVGKVCPDRVAVKFPSQLPTTDAMGSSMGRMAEELSIEKSSARKDGGRSSQQPKEERVRYMTEVFSKEPELQVNFLKYMFHVPHIKSMMYIPLNCAIIAQVYYESQSSRHVGIPRTRTQLYKALTHSLLVRHMEMKEQNYDYSSMFPEGLNEEDKKDFKTLAKFAFYSYHGLKEDIHQILGRSSKKLSKSELWKVTFFKEDIPEGLIHFGFMNESTEMYAGKGVEETFSFLHLSLQEYLAAWHLAKSYSIEFQVAYHRLACVPQCGRPSATDVYKGDNREEKALISSLEPLGKSLVEPAIFLAGITGMRCQSGDDRNHWEMYLSLDIASIESARMVLLRSLYEAQNQTMRPRIYNCNIVSSFPTPYDCYALSYCVSHLDQFNLTVFIEDGDDVSLLETFVKGLEDHRKSTTPKIKFLHLNCGYVANAFNRCIYWLNKVDIDTFCLESTVLKYAIDNNLLQSLVKFESLEIDNSDLRSWEWLPSLKSLTELKALSITNIASEEYMSPPPTEDLCWLLEHRLTEMKLDLQTSTDTLVDSVLKSALKSKQITKLELPSISRKAMASVHSIILHCPSLTTLRLEDTRLGYDGILYICSALRFNTTLRHLVILEDVQRPIPYRLGRGHTMSMKRVPLPGKATCTDFLLELNNILKDNTTLEEIKIQSGLFLPLSAA